ncbi:sensor histidine kinase RcsC [Rubritalea halochordaticola]|uniref:histidine kinase n=1 Tax=Rubritalea halochordaticola TaxID=714537 RepID=A0ABP9UXA0_9BACT
MRPLSLKWKIQLWYAALLALILTALSYGYYWNESRHRLNEFDDALDKFIHPIIAELGGRPHRHPRDRNGHPDELPPMFAHHENEVDVEGWEAANFNQITFDVVKLRSEKGETILDRLEERFSDYGFYGLVWGKNSQVLTGKSSLAPDIEAPSIPEGGYWKRTRDHRFREVAHRSPHAIAIVGFDLNGLNQELAALRTEIIAAASAIWLLGVIVGGLFVTRALKHLQVIERSAELIASGKLTERIPEPKGSRSFELVQLTDELNRTYAQLESLFDKQTRFTADASHELRTPLTALNANLALALEPGRSQSELVGIVKSSKRSSARLNRIIEDLLDLSRYDSGSHKLDCESLASDTLIEGLAEELEAYVNEKGSTLVTELHGDHVYCDPFRIDQVITNLVNNALQHNSEPIRITLRTRKEPEFTVIEVVDNGIGIQPENLNRLFDRFFQEDNSRQKKAKHYNIGLGLSICQAIVKAHSGTLTVTSTPHKETAFTIRLPRFADTPSTP